MRRVPPARQTLRRWVELEDAAHMRVSKVTRCSVRIFEKSLLLLRLCFFNEIQCRLETVIFKE